MKATNSKVTQLNTYPVVVSAVEYRADVGKLIALDEGGGEGRCDMNMQTKRNPMGSGSSITEISRHNRNKGKRSCLTETL
jgi:hypothetical protein